MELYAAVRRSVYVEGLSERAAARRFGLARETVRKMLRYRLPPGYRRAQPLWWQDPGGLLQGETSHQPEEAGAKLAAVHGLGASRSQCPAEGGDVPVGPRPRGRPSALLRHHG